MKWKPLQRGELYWWYRPAGDPRRRRAFVVVSRDRFITSKNEGVVCAPVYSRSDGLGSQVTIGEAEGMAHPSSIHCDSLVTVPKRELRDFIGTLPTAKLHELNRALAVALEIDPADLEDV